MRVTYHYVRPLMVFYARSAGPYATGAREAWKVMGRWLDQHNARRRMRVSYGLFRDNPRTTAAELLRYDACVPLIADLDADASAGIGRQTTPGGAYAVHIHAGSHEVTGQIFSRLHREIVPVRGLTVDYDRPFFVTYLNDPTVTRDIHRRTEICVPVVPMEMLLASNDATELVASSTLRLQA